MSPRGDWGRKRTRASSVDTAWKWLLGLGGLGCLLGLVAVFYAGWHLVHDQTYRTPINWSQDDKLLEQEDVDQMVEAEATVAGPTVSIQLRLRPTARQQVVDERGRRKLQLAEFYCGRFNEETEKRVLPLDIQGKSWRIVGRRDNLLMVERLPSGQINVVLRDLSEFNRTPPHKVEHQDMGPLLGTYQRDFLLLKDRKVRLVFDPNPQAAADVVVNLDSTQSGTVVGRSFALAIGRQTRWNIYRGPSPRDPELIIETRGHPACVNNGKPIQGQLKARDGDIIGLADRQFRLYNQASLPLSYTKKLLRGAPHRVYSLGADLSLLGPATPGNSAMSAGVDGFFFGGRQDQAPPRVTLTIDPYLQSLTTQKVREMAQKYSRAIYKPQRRSRRPVAVLNSDNKRPRASFCLMEAHTGRILVLSEGRDSEGRLTYDPNQPQKLWDNPQAMHDFRHKGLNLHVLGSMTKPLVAFCALQAYPYLKDLVVKYSDLPQRHILGLEVIGEGRDDISFNEYVKGLRVEFRQYLSRSLNPYQMCLGISALLDAPDAASYVRLLRSKGRKVSIEEGTGKIVVVEDGRPQSQLLSGGFLDEPAVRGLANSPLADGYRVLLGLDYPSHGTSSLDPRYLLPGGQPLQEGQLNRGEMCLPETVDLQLHNLHNLTEYGLFLFGGLSNMWTDVMVCQAFSRIITGRATLATLVRVDDKDGGMAPSLESTVKEYNRQGGRQVRYDPKLHHMFREALRGTIEDAGGTAHKRLGPVVKAIRVSQGTRDGAVFTVFAKTGTLRERDIIPVGKHNSKMLVFTFGMWNPETERFVGPAYTGTCYLQGCDADHQDAVLDMVGEMLPKWVDYLYGGRMASGDLKL